MEFEYSLNYFNNFDKIIYKGNSSVLDAAYKLKYESNHKIQELSNHFIKYIMFLIVLNIFNEKNEYDKKYLKEEKKFIDNFLNDRLDLLYSDNYINIINNYLFYRSSYNDLEEDFNNNKNLSSDINIVPDQNIYMNLFTYYSTVLKYNLNYCYYLRILTFTVNKLYAQYYLIILFTLWINPASKINKYKGNNELIKTINEFFNLNFGIFEIDHRAGAGAECTSRLLRYCYFITLKDLLKESPDIFFNYIDNIYNIIYDINNLISNYLNSKGISKLKKLISDLNDLNGVNPIKELNDTIWKEIANKFKPMRTIGSDNFNIEISNMLIELIDLLRQDDNGLHGEYYESYLKNFLENFYRDFKLKSLNISENEIFSLNDVIYTKYYNILINIENDYYLIYTNLICNEKIKPQELYYNLVDEKFNIRVDENLIDSDYLKENAKNFFNNYILISNKIDYIKNIRVGENLTKYTGNNFNIKNLSYRHNNVVSNTRNNNRISGISAFSSFKFSNPGYKNIFFNNYRDSGDDSIDNDIKYYLYL